MVVYLFERKGVVTMKKGNKIIRKLLMLLGCSLFVFGVLKIIYSLFMYILGLGINVFSGIILGGSIISVIGVLGMIPKCIRREVVDEYKLVDDSEYMRSQLHVVKNNDKVDNIVERNTNKKYSYVFDNEYRDDISYADVMIDDMSEFCDMDDFRRLGNVGYSRSKSKYSGRYLR